jgi:flagellar basal-body rod modification protein FlgD
MSAIPATSGSAQTQTDTQSIPAIKTSSLTDENTFLTLLVTQLKNQDPMNPADSTQFVTQLAQFTALEQMTKVSQNTASMNANDAKIITDLDRISKYFTGTNSTETDTGN